MDFLEISFIASRAEKTFRDIERAHRTATHCHLGNIAYWLKREIKWDPDKEEIIGDPEASRWIDRPKENLLQLVKVIKMKNILIIISLIFVGYNSSGNEVDKAISAAISSPMANHQNH